MTTTTIRSGERTVPHPGPLAVVAHLLRYDEHPLTQAERFTAAAGIDLLLGLVAARAAYGPSGANWHIREVLALMATGYREDET